MKKTLQTFRYLSKTFRVMILIEILVILSTLAASDVIYFLTDYAYNTVHPVVTLTAPFEVTAGIFSLLIGLVIPLTTFKVALANGISRKTFWLASLPASAIAAAAYSIFNLVVVIVHNLFWPMKMLSMVIYPYMRLDGLFIFQFTLYFLLVMSGWFIALALYRANKPVRWAISLAPFVLVSLLAIEDARTGGSVFEAIWKYQQVTMAMERAPFTLLAYSAVLYGLVYLLLRRAPLKD